MEIFKKNKLFVITLFSLILMIGAISILIVFNVLNLFMLRNRFLSLSSELQTLLNLHPLPTKKNVHITTENLQQIYKLQDNWRSIIGIFECSKTPIECYLNFQKEIECIKDKAEKAHVTINPKCYFGFYYYLNTEKLPKADNVLALDRQCQIIKMLSMALIQSNPEAIIEITREPIIGETHLDETLLNVLSFNRLNIHSIFYSNIFKLSFTGNTQALRLFINKIESMQIPLFIRNIQIAKKFDQNPSVVIPEGLAAFSITLELLDFKSELM